MAAQNEQYENSENSLILKIMIQNIALLHNNKMIAVTVTLKERIT